MPHLSFDSSRRLGWGAKLGALVERLGDALPFSFVLKTRLAQCPFSDNMPVLARLDVQEIETRMRQKRWGPIDTASRERTI